MFVRVFQVAVVFLLALPLLATLPARDAHAAAINCTGAGSETPTTNSTVVFDFSARTCTISDAASNVTALDDLDFQAVVGGGGEFFNRGTGGGTSNLFDATCTIGSFSVAAGVGICFSGRNINGNETATAPNTAADGIAYALTVDYTIAANGASIDITSARVTFVNSTDSAIRVLQSTVSRLQSDLIDNNIGTRVASASSARPLREDNGERDERSSGFADRRGFTADENGFPQIQSRGGSLRDFAMLASFDSSKMALSASENAQNPLRGVEQRRRTVAANPVTVWGHGSLTTANNNRDDPGDDHQFDGDVWGYNAGVDYRFTPQLVAGVSVGYSKTDLTTTFNTGTYEENNRSLSPYAIYQPMEDMTLSMIVGYSAGDVDIARDITVTGATNSDTWFASMNGSYVYEPSQEMPLVLKGRLNILISRKLLDAYVESDGTDVAEAASNTRRLKPGVEAAYSIAMQTHVIQPFVHVDYIRDYTDATNGDTHAFDLGGGLRVASSTSGLSGSFEAQSQLGRNDYSEHSVSGLIAYSFGLGNDIGQPGIAAPYFKSEFNPDSGPTFGTGLDFSSENQALSAGIGLTHSLPANGIGATAVEVQAALKF